MKNITNKALVLILVTMLSSTFLVNADDSETEDSKAPMIRQNMVNNIKEAKEQYKSAMELRKEDREQFMETQKEKREEAQSNREDFNETRNEAKDIFSVLSDENKEELKALRDAHEAATEVIKEKLKDNDLTLEEREALRADLETINEAFHDKMEEIVGENEEATAYLEARKELKEKNEALRQDAKIAREQYREGRDKQVEAQKEFYLNKLALVIPKVSDTKLESISVMAQKMIDKIEANTRVSDDKKSELIAKVISLIEILDEEIEARDVDAEVINVDEILN